MNPKPFDALLGALAADALSMPAHWYYDLAALRRDFGVLDHYTVPRHPHPDSILWRSSYEAPSPEADILREQARYWGQRGVHYHQFLAAGENTLNFRLAGELYRMVRQRGGYPAAEWAERYIELMLTPGWHRDTYVEEYHRAFFLHHSRGLPPSRCGIADIHIGGLAAVPALAAALWPDRDGLAEAIQLHVNLTHRSPEVLDAAKVFGLLLAGVLSGQPVREAVREHAGGWVSPAELERLVPRDDAEVIGQRFSPACYIREAFPASLYLVWKHHTDFRAGLVANANAGGDNCHRGAVVGGVLGAALGVPESWVEGLREVPVLRTPEPAESAG